MASASILSGKKGRIIRTVLQYNNLPCYTIKISGIHRFVVFASPRIDFIFHIPPFEEGTIVRMIPLECENGVTLLFRRSYPLLQILLFTRFTLSLARCAIFFSHKMYESSDDVYSLRYKFYKMPKICSYSHFYSYIYIRIIYYY